jgi:hypothetical protein
MGVVEETLNEEPAENFPVAEIVTEILRIQVTSVLMRKIFSPKNAAKKCLD